MRATSEARLRALNIIKDHPGLTAGQFAKLAWPHLRHGGGRMVPCWKARQYLGLLRRKNLVRRKLSGNPFVQQVDVVYYITDLGYELCDNENQARRNSLSGPYAGRARPVLE